MASLSLPTSSTPPSSTPCPMETLLLSSATMLSYGGLLFSRSPMSTKMVTTNSGPSRTCLRTLICRFVSSVKGTSSALRHGLVKVSRKVSHSPFTTNLLGGRNTPMVVTSCYSIPFASGLSAALSRLFSANSCSPTFDSLRKSQSYPTLVLITPLGLHGS